MFLSMATVALTKSCSRRRSECFSADQRRELTATCNVIHEHVHASDSARSENGQFIPPFQSAEISQRIYDFFHLMPTMVKHMTNSNHRITVLDINSRGRILVWSTASSVEYGFVRPRSQFMRMMGSDMKLRRVWEKFFNEASMDLASELSPRFICVRNNCIDSFSIS
jgi:hypothetical protein